MEGAPFDPLAGIGGSDGPVGPVTVLVDGVSVGRGTRVRLRPRSGGDVFDIALADRVAIVERIEQDVEDKLHVVVTLEDDPGRDLGPASQMGHRFFFALDEVEPIDADAGAFVASTGPLKRVLVAGIGNVFLGDDGFGVALAGRLAARALPEGVDVIDFGIRGMDLAFALNRGYDAAVLLDATPRGGAPGTLYLIDTAGDELGEPAIETHAMDPVRVLRTAASLGPIPSRVLVFGCEPETRMTGEEPEVVVELSAPVTAVLDEATATLAGLVEELCSRQGDGGDAHE
ncbi:MAG TPA: hydrogenase maturation protease [Conexibacter sp.]|jgi:hydrogenase maturation protease